MAWHPKWKLAFGYAWKAGGLLVAGTVGKSIDAVSSRRGTRPEIKCGWLPARRPVTVEYCAFAAIVEEIPESVSWSGNRVRLE